MKEHSGRKENVARVAATITESALTIPEIMKVTRLSQPCCLSIINELRVSKLAYLADWKRIDAGAMYRWVAAYQCGAGVDVAKPQGQSIEERRARNRAYKAAHKASKLDADEAERVEKIKRELARPAFRHWQDAALFGEVRA